MRLNRLGMGEKKKGFHINVPPLFPETLSKQKALFESTAHNDRLNETNSKMVRQLIFIENSGKLPQITPQSKKISMALKWAPDPTLQGFGDSCSHQFWSRLLAPLMPKVTVQRTCIPHLLVMTFCNPLYQQQLRLANLECQKDNNFNILNSVKMIKFCNKERILCSYKEYLQQLSMK